MRTPKSSSMSARDRTEKSTLSKTLRLTATIAALGASLGVSVESLNAAETAPKPEAAGLEAVQDKHDRPAIPEVVAPMPASVQHKEYIKTPPPSRVETQSPILTPKKIEKKPLPRRETQEETQTPAPAVMKPEVRSPLDEK